MPLKKLPQSLGLGLLAAATMSAIPAEGEGVSHHSRPNIILFLVDDMGWQDTSVPFWTEKTPFNNLYRTPSMERLAASGMKFTQAYACSVCSPTRVSLISGMNAARHRVTNWTLRRDTPVDPSDDLLEFPKWNFNGMQPTDSIENSVQVTTLPQILHDNGYFTIHCGKAHFGAMTTPAANPLTLGFDINIAGHAAGSPGSYLGEKNFGNAAKGGNTPPWGVPGLEKYHGDTINLTEVLTREAKLALDKSRATGKPFYLYMAHYAVHAPLEPDHRFYARYKAMGLPEPEARYASMLESMDKSLGDLMNYLDEKGITENTIILFMSDNGGLSATIRGGKPHTHNLPLKSGKGSACEGGIREPMIVKWPGVVKPNSVCKEYLIAEDFFPTILEMAGIRKYKTIQKVDGISFVPMLKQTGTTAKGRELFWHYPNKWGPTGPGIGTTSTIRSGDWKLIHWYQDGKDELYNISADIGEKNDLATIHPEIAKKLAKKLGDYLLSVNAQLPANKVTKRVCPYPGASETTSN